MHLISSCLMISLEKYTVGLVAHRSQEKLVFGVLLVESVFWQGTTAPFFSVKIL